MSLPTTSEICCPLCGESSFVRRLLFFSYCANPVHTHKKGEPPVNTVLVFRHCIEHGIADSCVPALLSEVPDESEHELGA